MEEYSNRAKHRSLLKSLKKDSLSWVAIDPDFIVIGRVLSFPQSQQD